MWSRRRTAHPQTDIFVLTGCPIGRWFFYTVYLDDRGCKRTKGTEEKCYDWRATPHLISD